MFDSWVHPQWALGGFFHCCPFTGRVEGCCGGDQSCLSQRGWGTIKALGWEWARAHRSAPVLDTCDDLMVGGDVTAKCWGILERISAMGPDIPSTSPAWRRVCSGLERESELKDTSPLFSAFSCPYFTFSIISKYWTCLRAGRKELDGSDGVEDGGLWE